MLALRVFAVLVLVLAVFSCGDDDASDELLEECYEPTISLEICDPAGTFSIDSKNPYFPLTVGNHTILEGMDDGELVRVELKVLDETEVVAGVTTRVIEAREVADGELEEVARDFYAVAADGTVCYFGEDVDFYEDGVIDNHEGTWRAGVDGARPGVIMPATPSVGQKFFQESAPEARDMSRVAATDVRATLAGTPYDNVVRMMDSNPLEGQEGCEEEEEKLFVAGIGQAQDTEKTLISFTPGT